MVAYSNLSVTDYELEVAESLENTAPLYDRPYHQQRVWPTVLQPRLFWRDTVDDLKRIPWKRSGKICFWNLGLLFWMGGLATCIALLVWRIQPEWSAQSLGDDEDDLCGPDGQFRIPSERYNYLRTATAFSINVGWGTFSFGKAKLIDVTWDIVIGRGGQGVLGLVTYFCFTRALTRIMETTTVSHVDFQSVTIHHASMQSLWIQLHRIFRQETVRARFLVFWMILSGIFVLSVPTFASAMTGYSINVDPFIAPSNASMLSAYDFDALLYTIHDGSRLGGNFTDDWKIFSPTPMEQLGRYINKGDIFQCDYCQKYDPERYYRYIDQQKRINSSTPCRIACEVSRYVATYGFLGRNQTQSEFVFSNIDNTSIILNGTSLNITAHIPTQPLQPTDRYYNSAIMLLEALSPTDFPYGLSWIDPETSQRPFLETPDTVLLSQTSDLTISLDNFTTLGICTASSAAKLTYKWGFSALLTLWFLCLLMIWTIGMWAVYVDTFVNSKLEANGRFLGSTRVVLDLHAAMSKRLEDEDTDLLSEDALKILTRGVRMDYQTLILRQDLARKSRGVQVRRWWGRFGVKTWAMGEAKWLVMLGLSWLIFFLSLVPPWAPTEAASITWLPLFATLAVLAMGKRRRSRWIFFWMVMLLFIILVGLFDPGT